MKRQEGFTLVEMMLAVVIAGIVMGSVMYTFTSQQRSYVVQEQVAMIQQNLRASMYYLTSEVQMAGYLVSSDINTYTMDWDPTSGGDETLSPLIYGRSDMILFVKADEDEQGTLASGEGNSGTSTYVILNDLDLDGDGDDDVEDPSSNPTSRKKYVILVKSDLSRSEFVKIKDISDVFISGATKQKVEIEPGFELKETYSGVSDIIARADILQYYVDATPALRRENLGMDSGAQVLGENISNMQIQYTLSDGSVVSGVSTADQSKVREVDVTLTGQATIPGAGLKQRTLRSRVKVRNLGVSM